VWDLSGPPTWSRPTDPYRTRCHCVVARIIPFVGLSESHGDSFLSSLSLSLSLSLSPCPICQLEQSKTKHLENDRSRCPSSRGDLSPRTRRLARRDWPLLTDITLHYGEGSRSLRCRLTTNKQTVKANVAVSRCRDRDEEGFCVRGRGTISTCAVKSMKSMKALRGARLMPRSPDRRQMRTQRNNNTLRERQSIIVSLSLRLSHGSYGSARVTPVARSDTVNQQEAHTAHFCASSSSRAMIL